MYSINKTHDVHARSWVESANVEGTDFPIQNLPFASFRSLQDSQYSVGVAIGTQILNLRKAVEDKLLGKVDAELSDALQQEKLNQLMALGKQSWSTLRHLLFDALLEGSDHQNDLKDCLIAQSDVEFDVPAHIGDYTDFYSSIYHATNVGKLFRPDNPLLPNYQWVPIGYHGRSSSIFISGTDFHRPVGQLKPPHADEPFVAPCQRLDYELEVGIYVGEGNRAGHAIPLNKAEDHIFGLCLFNDWSARDIQGWEYQPLGPFLSKNFASTVSPWVVTMEALAPYRGSWSRNESEPQPLSYLESEHNRANGNVDMQLEVQIETADMRANGVAPKSVAKSNLNHSYWTIAQMLTHHSMGGCNLRAGDLFASGTMSGPDQESVGALLEASEGGKHAIKINESEERTFLQDGDKVILHGWCAKEGAKRIGFGHAEATVLPAIWEG